VAARVQKLDSMSAHADRQEILRWLRTLPSAPTRLCLVHGEPAPMDALKTLVRDTLGWEALTPAHEERIEV
jgi:metallo-beta-lactamase family protein